MSCNLFDLFCSINTVLSNDSAVSAIVGDRIFNGNAPQDTPYPYLCFGGIRSEDFSTFDDDGDDMIIGINLYDRVESMTDLYNLQEAIKIALSRKEDSLCTDGCPVFFIKYSGTLDNPIKDFTNIFCEALLAGVQVLTDGTIDLDIYSEYISFPEAQIMNLPIDDIGATRFKIMEIMNSW